MTIQIQPEESGKSVVFFLRNGDAIHANLEQDPKGAIRLSLYCTNGNLLIAPIDSRCVRITTQTQLVGLERNRTE